LFSTGNINENAEHHPIDYSGIIALAARGYPFQLIADHNPKIDFIWADQRSGGRKCRANPVAMSRTYKPREVFETKRWVPRDAPQVIGMVIHRQSVGVYIP